MFKIKVCQPRSSLFLWLLRNFIHRMVVMDGGIAITIGTITMHKDCTRGTTRKQRYGTTNKKTRDVVTIAIGTRRESVAVLAVCKDVIVASDCCFTLCADGFTNHENGKIPPAQGYPVMKNQQENQLIWPCLLFVILFSRTLMIYCQCKTTRLY